MINLQLSRSFILKCFACLVIGVTVPLQAARAQEKLTEMNFAVLTFPSMTNTIVDVIIAKGFDRTSSL